MSNNTKQQAWILWVLAIVITLSAVVYQRKTGPTYPVTGEVTIDGKTVSYHLMRSQNTGENAEIDLGASKPEFNATLKWKRYKSHDEWRLTPFMMVDGHLKAYLPSQPPAGKIIYAVNLLTADGKTHSVVDEPTVIRFKGAVPAAVLIPHILFMFSAMLMATRTGMASWVESPATLRYTILTGTFLMLGGMILGPIVQKYAFDAYWTGWPWGTDLTDNKTAVAFISWILAAWRQNKTGNAKAWIISAAVITLAVYLIPHSAFGSELDYTQVEQ
ncbi:MAG: hypothetical protein HOB84_09885 [Candidatus Marinimicrobia bacterium]|jgi:hypothetical protein|nr:hypothetical protein [Candidatus Neomarinimicrobiota bacterium]MBT4360813.1 hypothetical protein [Candidatus Neomarinimicrobiota bacterium]MBT4715071.1 hypothetical protein [Candidatus Neomarinimicrobiota bacterium]MBT4945780.1 hypothetical protein [Candidatus Neomarinimicrobiota bacterium]MBT5271081.1 hypothetical protein [Candidatus Neomarinimicrobiota bacterium]